VFLTLTLAAFFMAEPRGELVCKYPEQATSQIVLRNDGSIRFVSEEVEDKDAVMKADIFRRTGESLFYKIVMVGRTDTFKISLTTLRGTQRLSYDDGRPEKVFALSCER
jgi:hypothetical protein